MSERFLVLDPRTKLLVVGVISVFMIGGSISGKVIFPRIALAAVPLILLLSGRRIKAAVIYAAVFTAGALSEAFLVFDTSGISSILITMLSGLVTRFVPCVVTGYYLLVSTTVSEFIAAMEKMHISGVITIPISVIFRFFPTVREEYASITDAMRMRGIGGMDNSPVKLLEYHLVPLMISIVKIGEDLSVSALTRGLGGPEKRTNICEIGFGIRDLILVVYVLTAAFIYKIL